MKIEPAMEVMPTAFGTPSTPPPTEAVLPGALPRGPQRPGGLELRFVTRMSRALGEAVARAAEAEGLTSGAWVRRLLMERTGIQSKVDYRSGRPIHRPVEEIRAISEAIRELAYVTNLVTIGDKLGAKASLDRVRVMLLPILFRHKSS